MSSRSPLQLAFRVALDTSYRELINQSYGPFLRLAQAFDADCESLANDPVVDQLQACYFLLKQGALKVQEGEFQDGENFLLIEFPKVLNEMSSSPSLIEQQNLDLRAALQSAPHRLP